MPTPSQTNQYGRIWQEAFKEICMSEKGSSDGHQNSDFSQEEEYAVIEV